MAAEQPGAFLLEVANIGTELNAAFTKFISYRVVHDRRLENLYATLDITTGALRRLGTSLNSHALDFQMQDDVTRQLAEKAKANFVALLTMAKEATAEGGAWKSEGTINGQNIVTEVDPWLLITMAVGGNEKAKDFWSGLDDTRDDLVEMEHVVKYMILKTMEEKSTLTADLEQELNKLKSLLPRIIQRQELVEKAKKAEAERLARVEENKKRAEERVRMDRRDSSTSSGFTIRADDRRRPVSPDRRRPVSPPEQHRPSSPVSERIIIKKDRDFDACSVTTYFTNSSSASDDTEEIYEEWILRWNPPVKTVNHSWGFLGLKLKNYYEDAGFWGTDPEFRTEDEMKEQETLFTADKSFSACQASIRKILQSLPKKGGLAIDHLLDERTESTSHEEAKREWIVVSVRPKQKHTYGSSAKWGKSRDLLTTDWLVTLKGTTISTESRSRSFRRDDPFARRRSRSRSYSPRYRSRSPMPRRRPIVIERERQRDRSPFRPLPMLRNPVRSLPMRQRQTIIEEGFVQGKVVVGKVMTRKEAEEKMVGIWEGMVKKAREPAEKKSGGVEKEDNGV